MYTVPRTLVTTEHMKAFMKNQPPSQDATNHVYELPNIEPAICYLHGDAGFPTKHTWLNAIRKGRYVSRPIINLKNVNKLFTELEETQKRHIRGKRQGVRSSQTKAPE